MPIHDWTRVPAGIFHDFHHSWVSTIKRALNGGLLPPGYYALAEQIAGGMETDVLTLEAWTDEDVYARKANAVVVRHTSGHEVTAMVELVSPGNKTSRAAVSSFARKAREALEEGIHLLIVDLFPPEARDPYKGGSCREAFLEPVAVGDPLPEMPLFLTTFLRTETYVPVPLEATYQAAWEAVPAYWRDVLTTPISRPGTTSE